MTKLRNAALVGALTLGITGAGVLAASPAFAAVNDRSGTMLNATTTVGKSLDVTMTGAPWALSPAAYQATIAVTVPAGTELLNNIHGAPGTPRASADGGWERTIGNGHWELYHRASDPSTVWQLVVTDTGNADTITTLLLPTLTVSQLTPAPQQGSVTFDLVAYRSLTTPTLSTDEVQPTAIFTWTADDTAIPVIAPAVGGAAAVAGLAGAGIVMMRRRGERA
ncbi:hypothetical protein SAMN04515691_3013 [Leifsonia sp. 98AMF]|uniref:peptide ABC transporter substrate-binding protein n=1 Tax=unclassified Leifsonia TaxID=2663824 RepID=UPI00087B51F5|nr:MULTISPECIES: peptide ABC transporter substrate-binding protein [unclassified Leifsonia]SDH15511.1 hypothetical protein SAMN04515690_1003 [Leifsonia sp. 197AMF]SDJ22735.1 hypothetical protein SAMN04515684_2779 [Leifsonia sp. 466MF]SDK60936.1 hypothetical protein SAMN04515683_3985 [Leifsonia sp. 157MF]SDN44419.1 hypothetical protein SAMN04515686_0963 [Leifsonia sp. 509MF]SEN66589.1 hypothetical protein SAMN04515685_3966 [Leifsonia sp. 467MF]